MVVVAKTVVVAAQKQHLPFKVIMVVRLVAVADSVQVAVVVLVLLAGLAQEAKLVVLVVLVRHRQLLEVR